jgi:hypothetical protein
MFSNLTSYFSSAQSRRDFVCLGVLLAAALDYEHYLRAYLAGVPQAMQLRLAFSCSLLFALWYEFKRGDWRGSLIRMAAITLVFLVAAGVAPYVRHEFFEVIAQAKADPYVVEAFSAEGVALMANPLAGFGACFGVSVMAARVLCGGIAVRILSRVAKHDGSVYPCPHCGDPIPR